MSTRSPLNRRLLAYSAAAGMTLAGAGEADAQRTRAQQKQAASPVVATPMSPAARVASSVRYTDVDPDYVFSSTPDSYAFDFDGDSTPEFGVALNSGSNLFLMFAGAGNAGTGYANAVGVMASGGTNFAYPDALQSGALISAGQTFIASASYFSMNYGSCSFGNWCNLTDRFLGLAIDVSPPPGAAGKVARATHYAWARLDVNGNGTVVTVKDFAMNNAAGQPIAAGSIVPLPVELTGFEVSLVDGTPRLTWRTATETDNAGFEVQARRIDQSTFRSLAFVDGAGTTTEAQSYTFDADGLEAGRYQFRLRQIDFDGSFAFSDLVEATISVPGTHVLTEAYPNPFNPSARFEVTVPIEQEVRVSLHDAQGREVQELFAGRLDADSPQTIRINAADLPSGVYLYRVVGANFTDAKTVSLVK
ncbi:MAG: T9SS type A sorting domain-containing protein [Bacteroidota bacterium]